MALSKVALDTTTGTGKSITALASGSSFTTDPWDVKSGISHEIKITVANANGTPDSDQGNVVVEIYASQDNTTWSNDAVFTYTFSPDTTSWEEEFVFNGLERTYIKVKIINNMKDSSGTGVSADFAVAIVEVRT